MSGRRQRSWTPWVLAISHRSMLRMIHPHTKATGTNVKGGAETILFIAVNIASAAKQPVLKMIMPNPV